MVKTGKNPQKLTKPIPNEIAVWRWPWPRVEVALASGGTVCLGLGGLFQNPGFCH